MENRVLDLGRRVHSVCLVLRCVQLRAATEVGQSGQGRGEGRETRVADREDYRGDATLTPASVLVVRHLCYRVLSLTTYYSYFSLRFSFFVPTTLVDLVQRDTVCTATQLAVPLDCLLLASIIHRRT